MLNEEILKPALAVRKIENYYICYRNKQLFKLLKTALCAAELSITKDILKKVAPMEATFFKDDEFTKMKVKFRFGGTEFPPKIYFKIYMESPCCCTNIYNHNTMMDSNKVCYGVLKINGNSQCSNILNVQNQANCIKRTFKYDIPNSKKCVEYFGNIDDFPAEYGGKNNPWRRLNHTTLRRNFPVCKDFHNSNSKNMSRFETYISHHDFKIGNYEFCNKNETILKVGKNKIQIKKKRKEKSEKMLNLYTNKSLEKINKTSESKTCSKELFEEHDTYICLPVLSDDWETDAQTLYEWTKELSTVIDKS